MFEYSSLFRSHFIKKYTGCNYNTSSNHYIVKYWIWFVSCVICFEYIIFWFFLCINILLRVHLGRFHDRSCNSWSLLNLLRKRFFKCILLIFWFFQYFLTFINWRFWCFLSFIKILRWNWRYRFKDSDRFIFIKFSVYSFYYLIFVWMLLSFLILLWRQLYLLCVLLRWLFNLKKLIWWWLSFDLCWF